jgi:hypothetical protein
MHMIETHAIVVIPVDCIFILSLSNRIRYMAALLMRRYKVGGKAPHNKNARNFSYKSCERNLEAKTNEYANRRS